MAVRRRPHAGGDAPASPREVPPRSVDTLTGEQRFQLRLGTRAGMAFVFDTIEAAEGAWFAVRHELMARNQLARWPAAYFVFELGEDPPWPRRILRAVDPSMTNASVTPGSARP
jgi:hypothetical protein